MDPAGSKVRMSSTRGWIMLACLILSVAAAPCLIRQSSGQAAKRPIRFPEIPSEFHGWLKDQGVTADTFDDRVAAINRETAERELRGEYEHLIYYALQSTRFTRLPGVEPALSAREFALGLSDADRRRWLDEKSGYLPSPEDLPHRPLTRLKEFINAIKKPSGDERLDFFQQFIREQQLGSKGLLAALCREYASTMRFLYLKEFSQNAPSAEQVAELYQTRGHSTDTRIEANFAAYQALAIISAERPGVRLNRILIVGPGLDFAPRTELIDLFGPQSYQPFAIADALLSLGLASPEKLKIDIVDINRRVVSYIRSLRNRTSLRLSIISGIADREESPLTAEYKHYFENLGSSIGRVSALKVPAELADRPSKTVEVRPGILNCLSATGLNLITERFDPSPAYDLIVVTNVFPYFSDLELAMALTNISRMLAREGYFVHNEPRVTARTITQSLDLPLRHSRTVLVAAASARERVTPLYDFVGIHQKQ